MSWLDAFRGPPVPPAMASALARDEAVLAVVPAVTGHVLAATRLALYVLEGDDVERVGWHLISKARLDAGTLSLIVADEIGRWPDGTALLQDRPVRNLRPVRRNRLTDVVHQRVRGSVVASRHISGSRATGWVVLRRIAGEDGLTVQFRLERGSPDADGLGPLVTATADQLRASVGRFSIDE